MKTARGERDIWGIIRQFSALFGLVILVVVLSLWTESFRTIDNFLNVLSQTSIITVMAIGCTFVILTGGIDLSVGSVLGLCAVLSAGVVKSTGNPWLAIAVCLAIGTGLGLVNGILIAYQKLPPFVATLGMMSVARGICFIYTQGRPISGFPEAFRFFGSAYIFEKIPVVAIEAFIFFLMALFVLKRTPFGRYIYAIGSNETATRLSGIHTPNYKLAAYVICGFLCGVAGLMFAGRINSGHPTAGEGYELNAIAAVVIGGTSLAGGRGTVGGTVIGALIMGVISNGLNLLNVDSYWQKVVLGAVIILAVLVDIKSKRHAEGGA